MTEKEKFELDKSVYRSETKLLNGITAVMKERNEEIKALRKMYEEAKEVQDKIFSDIERYFEEHAMKFDESGDCDEKTETEN